MISNSRPNLQASLRAARTPAKYCGPLSSRRTPLLPLTMGSSMPNLKDVHLIFAANFGLP